MAGTIYKRCRSCGRKVVDRECTKPDCDGTGVVWAFSVSLGKRPDGRPRRVLRSGFRTKRDAQAALDDIRTNTADQHVRPRTLTLGEYLQGRWLPRLRTTEKTRSGPRHAHGGLRHPSSRGDQLVDLTGEELNEMYDDLAVAARTAARPELGWGLSATSIRHIHTQLHKAFADAIRWGLLHANPCDQADPPSTTEVKARAMAARKVYSWDQLQRFVAQAAEDRLFAMWQLFVTTACGAARWRGCTGTRSTSRPRCCRSSVAPSSRRPGPRAGVPQVLVVAPCRRAGPADVDVLRLHRPAGPRGRRRPGSLARTQDTSSRRSSGAGSTRPTSPRCSTTLTDAAGLPRIRLHDLRHTHATLLLKAGEVTKVVTERLGHSTTAYTQDTYQHVLPGMQRGAATRFHERLGRLPADELDEPADDTNDDQNGPTTPRRTTMNRLDTPPDHRIPRRM